MTFSFGLLYLLAVLFLQELPHNKKQKFLRYAPKTAMGIAIWGECHLCPPKIILKICF
jgi:hypothetical protein